MLIEEILAELGKRIDRSTLERIVRTFTESNLGYDAPMNSTTEQQKSQMPIVEIDTDIESIDGTVVIIRDARKDTGQVLLQRLAQERSAVSWTLLSLSTPLGTRLDPTRVIDEQVAESDSELVLHSRQLPPNYAIVEPVDPAIVHENDTRVSCSSGRDSKDGADTKLIIPFGVRTLAPHCFDRCATVAEVELASTVSCIGTASFAECTRLKDVQLSNVAQIKSVAFFRAGMRTIDIGQSVTELGIRAFAEMPNLERVIIDCNAPMLPSQLCQSCPRLRSVVIGNSVTCVGKRAFSGCPVLSEITLPSRIKTISEAAFANCESLSRVSIPVACTTLGSGAFAHTALTHATLPSALSIVSDAAFVGCTQLETLDAQGDLVEVGSNAFRGCTALRSVHLRGDATIVAPFAFMSCPMLMRIQIDGKCDSIGESAFEGCSALSDFTIPSQTNTIAKRAFALTALTEASIPGNIENLKPEVFADCRNLCKVAFAEGVCAIEKHAFLGCASLQMIERPRSLVREHGDAYQGCPAAITVVRTYANCTER